MLKQELIEKSPVRVLEKGIEGGLKAGNIGVIASRKGIGKTSVLVQIALDKLFQGKKVIHVSFVTHASYVISWYENIFTEVAKRKNLEHAGDIHEEVAKNRVLMNFNQEGTSADQIIKSLKALIVDGGFKAEALIVDGFDFAKSTPDRLAKVRDLAREMDMEVWYSCTLAGEEPLLDKNNVPVMLRDFMPNVSVLILLEPKSDHIQFSVVKDHDRMNPHDLKLKLESKTLLIAEI
jgi:hypothetical protein